MPKTTFGVSKDVDPEDDRGPAFVAEFPGDCFHDKCGDEFEEGMEIRARGDGEYECAYHKDEGD